MVAGSEGIKDALSGIWCDVLQCAAAGIDDNFFALGGDSIKAIQISQRIVTELGVEIPFIDILRLATIRELYALIQASEAPLPTEGVTPLPPQPSYPLSAVQREFYFLEQMTRREDASLSATVMHFEFEADAQRSKTAFDRIMQRHEILRTTFVLEEGVPRQIVHSTDSLPPAFDFTDCSLQVSPEKSVQEIFTAKLSQPFDLHTGPVVRFHVCNLGRDRAIGILSLHHVAADGFSAGVIERDFVALYHADPQLEYSPLPFHYKDYAHWLEDWLATADGLSARAYWQKTLTDYRRHDFLMYAGSEAGVSFAAARKDFLLSAALSWKVRQISESTATSLFVVMQSLLRVFLFVETGAEDIIIGSPITTRDTEQLTNQVGPYLNTLPIRARSRADQTFCEFVATVNDATLGAYAYKSVPFSVIVSDVAYVSKLFDVGFTLQSQNAAAKGTPAKQAQPRLTLVRPVDYSEGLSTKVWFVATERHDGIEINVHYQKTVLAPAAVEAMIERFKRIIGLVLESPATRFDMLGFGHASVELGAIELDFGD